MWWSQSKIGPYGRSTVRKAPRLVRVRARGRVRVRARVRVTVRVGVGVRVRVRVGVQGCASAVAAETRSGALGPEVSRVGVGARASRRCIGPG